MPGSGHKAQARGLSSTPLIAGRSVRANLDSPCMSTLIRLWVLVGALDAGCVWVISDRTQ